jgi:hypothetical protein
MNNPIPTFVNYGAASRRDKWMFPDWFSVSLAGFQFV